MQRQVEHWRQTQITDERARTNLLFGLYRRQARSAQEPAARGPPALLRAAVPGILATYDVEFVERLHQRLQEARSSAAVQGNSEAGRLSFPAPSILQIGPARGYTLNGPHRDSWRVDRTGRPQYALSLLERT